MSSPAPRARRAHLFVSFVSFVSCVSLFALVSLLTACADRRRAAAPADGGSTTMGTDGGSTTMGTDGGSTTMGTDGGSTTMGTDGGSTTMGTDGGSTTMGTDGGSTTMGTDGGSTTMGTDGGSTPGGVTIGMIQRGMIPVSTIVTVRNVVVTALYSTGAWVQDPAGGATYSGIRVYTGAAPTVAIGDRVDVMGEYIEYFDDSEIQTATITRLGAGTPIAPVSVSAATAATEPYEGVLVRVSGAVTNAAYDCVGDDPGCSDAELWEIGGPSGVVAFRFVYQSGDWASHIASTPLTGVMGWRYNRRRIMPRTAADF